MNFTPSAPTHLLHPFSGCLSRPLPRGQLILARYFNVCCELSGWAVQRPSSGPTGQENLAQGLPWERIPPLDSSACGLALKGREKSEKRLLTALQAYVG